MALPAAIYTKPTPELLQPLIHLHSTFLTPQVARIAFVNNGAIRRHFHDLTFGLLQPLQQYVEPAEGVLPSWDPEAFLLNLKTTQAAAVPSVISDRWVQVMFTQVTAKTSVISDWWVFVKPTHVAAVCCLF
jgi:hypothetical protein